MTLTDHAYELLKSDPLYLADAKTGRWTHNTIAGSVMAITTQRPRWVTEEAVRRAIDRINSEEDTSYPP